LVLHHILFFVGIDAGVDGMDGLLIGDGARAGKVVETLAVGQLAQAFQACCQ
jgi:hypothetical protein